MCRSTLRRLAAALLPATLGLTFALVPLTLSGCDSAPDEGVVEGDSEMDLEVEEDMDAYDEAAAAAE